MDNTPTTPIPPFDTLTALSSICSELVILNESISQTLVLLLPWLSSKLQNAETEPERGQESTVQNTRKQYQRVRSPARVIQSDKTVDSPSSKAVLPCRQTTDQRDKGGNKRAGNGAQFSNFRKRQPNGGPRLGPSDGQN